LFLPGASLLLCSGYRFFIGRVDQLLAVPMPKYLMPSRPSASVRLQVPAPAIRFLATGQGYSGAFGALDAVIGIAVGFRRSALNRSSRLDT
jgi:hypothetical protein